jgi:hypothetical protein
LIDTLAAIFFILAGGLMMVFFRGGGEGVSYGKGSVSAGLSLFLIGSLILFGVLPFP